MAELFEQTTLRSITLRNRLVRSATWEGMCDDNGHPSQQLIDCYGALARGGIGLIISGYAYVRQDGKQLPRKMGMHNEEVAAACQQLAAVVHDAGGKIAVQLVHAGGQANSKAAGCQPLAPSAIKAKQYPELPRELTTADIADITDAFAQSARRVREAGFDAVQLHGAHGYLINQFLSPHTNQRTDQYGGNIENRTRFLMEVYDKVRQTVGDKFPVMIKLSGCDNLPDGLSAEDAIYAATQLSQAGIDAIEVSSGTSASGDDTPIRTGINYPEKEAYNLALSRNIKRAVTCPVISVGGFRSYAIAQESVQNGDTDYVAICRPLIREPALANRWQSGDHATAKCISCNACFTPGLKGKGIYCVVANKQEQ